MKKQPQMATIADLRNDHLAVLAKLETGPVIVNNQSNPVAVMMSPKLWDKIAEYIEEIEDLKDMYKAELELATGKDTVVHLTQAEIAAWLAEEDDLGEEENKFEDQLVRA